MEWAQKWEGKGLGRSLEEVVGRVRLSWINNTSAAAGHVRPDRPVNVVREPGHAKVTR